MATPPTAAATATATLNLDKCISAARRMNPQPAKNTSLPFSSINLTRPATEQSLPATRPSLHPHPFSPRHHPPPSSDPFLKILRRHTVAEQMWWRRRKWEGRMGKKEFTRLHWVGVSDLWEKEEKRRLKCWGAMKNDPWMEALLTLLHAGQGMRCRTCLSVVKCAVAGCWLHVWLNRVGWESGCVRVWWERVRQAKLRVITRHAD